MTRNRHNRTVLTCIWLSALQPDLKSGTGARNPRRPNRTCCWWGTGAKGKTGRSKSKVFLKRNMWSLPFSSLAPAMNVPTVPYGLIYPGWSARLPGVAWGVAVVSPVHLAINPLPSSSSHSACKMLVLRHSWGFCPFVRYLSKRNIHTDKLYEK